MAEDQKILVAEVADNTVWYKFFPHTQNVYFVRTDNIYAGFANSQFELDNIGLTIEANAISFQVRKIHYFKVTTFQEVLDNPGTFLYTDKT
ncbi:MAG: hypothetical protein GWN64_07995, partial [Candidatus Thorarchaeota archaeon]|nr:hypothetical protein [Candidatus Thorarchaeota archaeon]